jgi:hypothetical protein
VIAPLARRRTDGANLRYCLWLLKNSFGAFALKTRRARMPYKRFSPPRDTFLVTQFRQLRHFKGLFQQPRLITTVSLGGDR